MLAHHPTVVLELNVKLFRHHRFSHHVLLVPLISVHSLILHRSRPLLHPGLIYNDSKCDQIKVQVLALSVELLVAKHGCVGVVDRWSTITTHHKA